MEKGLREQFLKIYANLPLSVRKEIILIFNKEPMTWNAVYVETFNNTEKSAIMLNKLRRMKII